MRRDSNQGHREKIAYTQNYVQCYNEQSVYKYQAITIRYYINY